MAVGAGNAGDGDVTGWGKAFMDTGAGLKAMRAQRETADAAVWAKRGVDGDEPDCLDAYDGFLRGSLQDSEREPGCAKVP